VGPRACLHGCGKLDPTEFRSPDRPASGKTLIIIIIIIIIIIMIIIIIVIIFINCKSVDTRWQWSFYILHMHGL
jgi:uncharacterized integral membrane protein